MEEKAGRAGTAHWLIAAAAVGLAALVLYVAAFWPTLVGEASNACEGRPFDRTAWPPGGDCGDAPWHQFGWTWADAVVLALSGLAASLAVIALARRLRTE